jgi:hypothetical protein
VCPWEEGCGHKSNFWAAGRTKSERELNASGIFLLLLLLLLLLRNAWNIRAQMTASVDAVLREYYVVFVWRR